MNRESRYPKTILGLCVLASVVGTQALAAVGFAQDQENWDSVTRINDELIIGVATTYFNAEHCADPSSTDFDLTLTDGAGVTQAFIWVGLGDNPGCQDEANRRDDALRCRPLAANPKQVGDNTTVFDITLQELIDSEIVDCDNTDLTGARYLLYAFRNEAPGGTDVPTDDYGTAPITVDVVPPAELNITSALEQTGSVFRVSWTAPPDAPLVAFYNLYASPEDDPADALSRGPVAGTVRNATNVSVSADALGLKSGEEAYLFVTAIDEASVTGAGNEGPPSVATRAIAALDGAGGDGGAGGAGGAGAAGAAGVGGGDTPDGGDGGGGGCSAARTPPIGAPTSVLGLLAAILWVRKRFRIT